MDGASWAARVATIRIVAIGPAALSRGQLLVVDLVVALARVGGRLALPLLLGHLALRRSGLPVDLRLLPALGLTRPLDRCGGALATFDLALLRRPLTFVRELLALVSRPLPYIGQQLAFVSEPVALVGEMLAPAGRYSSPFEAGVRPVGLRPLPALGLSRALQRCLGARATLQLALLGRPLALGCRPLTVVRRQFPQVRAPLAVIRDPPAFASQVLAGGDSRLVLLDALHPPLERPSETLAAQRQLLTLSGQLLPLLGDVLALVRDALTFPSHPDKLVRLASRPIVTSVRIDFSG